MIEQQSLKDRVQRESQHGLEILKNHESNWGWSTIAGQIRKQRRADFLTSIRDQFPYEPKVLEVGCGTGTFTEDLSKTFQNLTSIDVSTPLLERAKIKFPAVRFENVDIHQSVFPNDCFDLIVGCSVLHHLEWNLALNEIFRIVKPGGLIRFSEPNLLNPQIFLQKSWPYLKNKLGDSPDEYAFTPKQIRYSLHTAGFEEILAIPFEFLHPQTPTRLIPSVLKLESVLEKTRMRSIAGSIKITAKKPL